MTLTATIKVYHRPDDVHAALSPEEFKSERASLVVKKRADHAELVIEAADAAAMRALFNSMMKSITVFDKMEGISG